VFTNQLHKRIVNNYGTNLDSGSESCQLHTANERVRLCELTVDNAHSHITSQTKTTSYCWVQKKARVTCLQVIRKFWAAGITWIHCDEDRACGIQRDLSSFKQQLLSSRQDTYSVEWWNKTTVL